MFCNVCRTTFTTRYYIKAIWNITSVKKDQKEQAWKIADTRNRKQTRCLGQKAPLLCPLPLPPTSPSWLDPVSIWRSPPHSHWTAFMCSKAPGLYQSHFQGCLPPLAPSNLHTHSHSGSKGTTFVPQSLACAWHTAAHHVSCHYTFAGSTFISSRQCSGGPSVWWYPIQACLADEMHEAEIDLRINLLICMKVPQGLVMSLPTRFLSSGLCRVLMWLRKLYSCHWQGANTKWGEGKTVSKTVGQQTRINTLCKGECCNDKDQCAV
jgi:hypothetical protein